MYLIFFLYIWYIFSGSAGTIKENE